MAVVTNDHWGTRLLRTVQWCNWLLLLALTVGSLLLAYEKRTTLGVVTGGLISVGNFALLVRILRPVRERATSGAAIGVKLSFKFLFLMTMVAVLLLSGQVDPIGFAVGLSVAVVSVLGVSLIHAAGYPGMNSETTDA